MPSSGKSWPAKTSQFPFWVWPLYFLLLWQILLWAQNPGLMADDSGETAAAAWNLGLPHPPGYPLFDLIGHLVCWISVGSVAFRLNLFSGFLALLSLAFTLDTARKLDDLPKDLPKRNNIFSREILLAVLGLVFISCRVVFAQSLTAKGCIYTLTLLLTSVAVWLYLFQQSHPEDDRPFLGALFLWAVGLSNHWQTLILWVPFLMVWSFQKKRFWKPKTLLLGASFILVGLSLYLYLPLRARLNCEPCWGYPINLPLFYWVISRQLVAGVEHWIQTGAFYLEAAKEMARTGFLGWLPGFVLMSLGGLVLLWRENKGLFFGFAAFFFPVLLGVFAVHEEYNTYLLPAYLTSLSGLVVLFGFAALRGLQSALPKPRQAVALAVFLGLVSAAWFVPVFRTEDKSRYTLMDDFGTNVMKALPRGTIFLADGDHYVMPIWYEHYAEGLRPDLIFEPSVFLYHGWGWKQLVDQSPDFKSLVDSSNLFQDRLNALTRSPSSHPLFRSLGDEFLGPAFQKMPGAWVPRGLVYGWKSRQPSFREVLSQTSKIIAEERLRGLEEPGNLPKQDWSSRQIYRYYASQLTGLKP